MFLILDFSYQGTFGGIELYQALSVMQISEQLSSSNCIPDCHLCFTYSNIKSSRAHYNVGAILIPTLQVMKQKHRELSNLPQTSQPVSAGAGV